MARVLHRFLVEPSPSLPERALPLTFLDALWLGASPVERVFYYRVVEATDDLVSNLKDSLSRALRDFYPLAGRLRLTPGMPNRYELHYQPGDAVAFTVAEYGDVGVDELATDDPKGTAKVSPLAPPLPEGGAVLALQVTVLRDGLTLAMTVHHAACDGAFSTHFLHSWASWAAARTGAAAPEPPVVDRSFVRGREDLYDFFAAQGRKTADDSGRGSVHLGSSEADRRLFATFVLSNERLQGVKHAVAREAARRGVPTPRSTSIVATFGLIWHCYHRAFAKPDAAPANSERAYLLFSADLRARMEPPVPERYLGNCVGPCLASAPREELAGGGASGLFAACAAVAGAVDGMVRGGPAYLDGSFRPVTEAYASAGPEAVLTAAGSPRFRVYDVDFGFGRPAKVEIVSVAKTGAISVAEGRRGMEVGISSPVDGMDRFDKCFAEAMACIASSS